MQRITFIGGGNMARSLIGGLLRAGSDATSIHVAEPRAEARTALMREFGVTTHSDNDTAIATAEVVVLAIKPQVIRSVCATLGPKVAQVAPLVISIAAGIRTDQVERWLATPAAIVRVMPNTPALIGAGANGLFANARVSAAQRDSATAILSASGICEWIDDEALMDTVTALSGSGPAYFFAFVEALEDAAVTQGLPREAARHLAVQTCLGAGRMLSESGEAPAELRRRVTSPNGTTQAALESFAADNLPAIAAHAVDAARRRGVELAASNDD